MKHLGDITKINGTEIEPVNCIIGGSPCQDLSVAGKRAGLDGARSGLFMEMIRIIKEMRNGTDNLFPRYTLWENVPGAFSSNKGEDFRAVLEEFAHIADETVNVPRPADGKWRAAGVIMGDQWSIAYRVLDAQYFGVPQRRRRIALIADFGGQSAPEILFEQPGLSGDFAESGETGEKVAGEIGNGVGAAKYLDTSHADDVIRLTDTAPAMQSRQYKGGNNVLCYGICSYASNSMKSDNPNSGIYVADTARTLDGNSGNPACNQGGIAVVEPLLFEPRSQDGEPRIHNSICPTPNTAQGGQRQPCVCLQAKTGETLIAQKEILNAEICGIKVMCLLQQDYGAEAVSKWGFAIEVAVRQANLLRQGMYEESVYGETENGIWLVGDALPRPETVAGWLVRDMWKAEREGRSSQGRQSHEQRDNELTENMPELSQLNSSSSAEMFDMWRKGQGLWILRQALSEIQKIRESVNVESQPIYTRDVVRRLTPLEAERLMGYPDYYTYVNFKGKPASDSARYKALGNSIALPPWRWIIRQMSAYLPPIATMGSLFDGIGGFPLLWQEWYGRNTALWASEIEPFCVAVTEARINGGTS